MLGATLETGQSVTHAIGRGRKVYLVAATGAISVDGVPAAARDGVAVADQETVTIGATDTAEIVLVDVP